MDWKVVNAHGATAVSRVVGVYEVVAPSIPSGGRFKVKVLEERDGEFLAFPNVCLKDATGAPDWGGASGRTELEALERALEWFMGELNKRGTLRDVDFEWSDPCDF